MRWSKCLRILMLVAAAMHASPARPASAGEALLTAGMRDFQAGRYAAALAEFLQARNTGNDSAALRYNLAVTYYKLNRDREAIGEFEALLRNPRLGDYARYNLALLAQRAGRKTEAREYFHIVEEKSSRRALRALARSNLESSQAAVPPRALRGYIRLQSGFDDNVALASPTELMTVAEAGSAQISADVGARMKLSGTWRNGLQIVADAYSVRYPDQSLFNQLGAGLGAEYHFRRASWELQTGGRYAHWTYSGDRLESIRELSFGAEHSLAETLSLTLDYRLRSISGGPEYDYLSGSQNQLAIQADWRSGPLKLSLGYRLTVDDRKDLVSDEEYFNASPVRNQMEAGARWSPGGHTDVYIRGRFYQNRYERPNVLLEDDALMEMTRADDGYAADAGVKFRLRNNCRLGAEYQYRFRDSNISRYSYRANRYLLDLQYLF